MKPVITTVILPRLRASSEWFSRDLSAKMYVEMMCETLWLDYEDLWENFA